MGGAQRALQLTLPAVKSSIPKARKAIAPFAEECQADAIDIATAVTEAVGNAVLHAYREGVPTGDVRIEAVRDHSHLVVTVSDKGVGMKPNPNSEGLGLGSTLITSMASEATYSTTAGGHGVCLTMRFICGD
jgi:anti-sigma regulatory factor (Ser/Thr protein kinase)